MSEYSYEKNVRFDSVLVKGDSVDNNKLKKKEKLLFDTNNSVKATNSNNLEQIADNIWNDVNETNWVGLPTTGDNLETHLGLISSDKSIEIYNIYKEKHGETIFSSIITEYGLPINTRIKYCKDLFNKMAKNAIANGVEKDSVKAIQKEFYAELKVQKDKFGPANADKLNEIASKLQRTFNYELGDRVDDTRIVDTDSISSKITGSNSASNNSSTQSMSLVDYLNNISNTYIDGVLGTSNQQGRGDCYFLATVNSIRNTTTGQEVLQKNIKKNNDGSYTVTFPGALEVKKHYEPICRKKGIECDVTGKYKITKEAIAKAGTLVGQSYSKGDMDVVLLEIAMENYRKEFSLLCQKLDIKGEFGTAEGDQSPYASENNYLSGGYPFDAMFILTGKKSEDVFQVSDEDRPNVKLYDSNKYPRISRAEFDRKFNTGMNAQLFRANTKSIQECENITEDKSDLNKLLDKYSGKENEFVLTFNVTCAKDGPDGETIAGGGHALSVLKITSGEVYVANPWHPDEIEIIPRQDFIDMSTGFAAAKM